ncbi:hypothetical protein PFICI_05690 [Pestalotiopsis fici W106-1]|uniref:Uncharacterized protein n=1 Tax=Pestalotiopsis fici (strain W106-1 / CGMCC3.15140) TaxID=1229662 RepID=W3XCT1_PESFW|nr:uncharacterized protein PFICI_05690 [Pestalotiopsis fici W106-1]ETS83814.1 hypothetical protein PFICI_05690 [Pestalotiopsis fici W106-1]
MSSLHSSPNDWSMAGSYQSEYQSFNLGSASGSEESSYLQISSNQPDSDQSSEVTGRRPPPTTTGGGSDDIHCTHSLGVEHCLLHSHSDQDFDSSSSVQREDTSASDHTQEPDNSESPLAQGTPEYHYAASQAMERYLDDDSRHERIALGYSSVV